MAPPRPQGTPAALHAHHDPPGSEQPLVELRQHVLAPDEPAVALPLDREGDQLGAHRRWRQSRAAFAHAASLSRPVRR